VPSLFYIRLISLTTGTLVYLFLLALILGHRRPRLFERLLFFLTLSLFLIFASGLLDINAVMQYGSPPEGIRGFANVLSALGMSFLLPLIWHAHVEYVRAVQQERVRRVMQVCVVVVYVITLAEVLGVAIVAYKVGRGFGAALLDFETFRPLNDWLVCAASATALQLWASGLEKSPTAKRLGYQLLAASVFLTGVLILREFFERGPVLFSDALATATIVGAVLPGALLIYYAFKHNFLDYGAQRNLVYALSAMVLALLYLALVRRVSGWLEPVLPPEATASVLLFVLIFVFEPLERAIGPVLHRQLAERMERVQRLTSQLQQEARQGKAAQLLAEAERRIREEFGLAAVRIAIPRDAASKALEAPGGLGHAAQMRLLKDGQEIGVLEAATTGSYLTGETTAALEFLAEQLPGMVDLARLIEDKLRLERELAERERMAVLGQMAASVSHNLRNPLSSMKTVLQVQLENPDLPLEVRRDCTLIVGEIDRMSAKLTQLLHYAKPTVHGERVAAVAVAAQTAWLFGRDAERRNVRLEFEKPTHEIMARASQEALSEVLSNLIVNAMEAQPDGGRVRISVARYDGRLDIVVDDDGPGITRELRAKIFQPYFTTKATGTGLGLSIVARRIEELSGTLAVESPLRHGKGTRFHLTLPLAEEEGERS
jgi:signal transduction histidine kinase